KLYDVKSALEEIGKYHFNPQIIAFIQNGIVDQDFYVEFQEHPGLITVSVFNGYNLTDNNIIVRESHLGLQVEDTVAGRKICDLFTSAGIRCHPTPNIEEMRVKKLITNAASNALSAIEKKTIGELIADKKLKEVFDGIIQESWAVLKDDYHLPSLEFLQEEIYQLISKVKEHYSSMYQDLRSGRNTEIEFLNGFIVNLGIKKGITTPYNQQVYLATLAEQKNYQ
ncbi:ketopantoate reductase C-terminal domain-containing protein, partial [Calothrix rhizosoleniae]|uniref:ketopantoate reductase C-terminal domain-containing protein n=1 Tax=Calothrix rhizosoleniae TaxID=888997 RepID=UPI001F2FBAB6